MVFESSFKPKLPSQVYFPALCTDAKDGKEAYSLKGKELKYLDYTLKKII